MILEVVAQHLGRKRVDGSTRCRNGAHDFLAPTFLGERPFHSLDLPFDSADPRHELPLMTDRVHS